MIDQLGPGLFVRRVHTGGVELRPQLVRVARPRVVRLQRVHELDPRPRPRQVDLVAAEGRLRPARRRLCCALDQRLQPLHRVAVVGVRLVPLELRELRRVLVGDAFVAEVLRELVHPLEASDDQPLEVELVRDPQVEVAVEEVGVRDKRLRKPAAVARAAGWASRLR